METSLLKKRNKKLESENRKLKLELLERNHQKENPPLVDEIALLKDQIAFLMGDSENIANPEYHFRTVREMLDFKHKFVCTIENLNSQIKNLKTEMDAKVADFELKMSLMNREIEDMAEERDLAVDRNRSLEDACKKLEKEAELGKCKLEIFESFVEKSENLLKENSNLMADNESKRQMVDFFKAKNRDLEEKLNFFLIKENKNKIVFGIKEELKIARDDMLRQKEAFEEIKKLFEEMKTENYFLREEVSQKEAFIGILNSKMSGDADLKNELECLKSENDELCEKIRILEIENVKIKNKSQATLMEYESKLKEETERALNHSEIENKMKEDHYIDEIKKLRDENLKNSEKLTILLQEKENLRNDVEKKDQQIHLLMTNNENELLRAMSVERAIMNAEIENLKMKIKNSDKSIGDGLSKIGIESENLSELVIDEFKKKDILLKSLGELGVNYETLPEFIENLQKEVRKFAHDLEKKNKIINLLKEMNLKLKAIVAKNIKNGNQIGNVQSIENKSESVLKENQFCDTHE